MKRFFFLFLHLECKFLGKTTALLQKEMLVMMEISEENQQAFRGVASVACCNGRMLCLGNDCADLRMYLRCPSVLGAYADFPHKASRSLFGSEEFAKQLFLITCQVQNLRCSPSFLA